MTARQAVATESIDRLVTASAPRGTREGAIVGDRICDLRPADGGGLL
jgi:hypothetical protein